MSLCQCNVTCHACPQACGWHQQRFGHKGFARARECSSPDYSGHVATCTRHHIQCLIMVYTLIHECVGSMRSCNQVTDAL